MDAPADHPDCFDGAGGLRRWVWGRSPEKPGRAGLRFWLVAVWLVLCPPVAAAAEPAGEAASVPAVGQASHPSDTEPSEPDNSTGGDDSWHGVDESEPEEPAAGADRSGRPLSSWAEAHRPFRDEIRRTLAYYFHRPETTARRSPWEVMHAVIGFGVDTPLQVGERQVNAIAWLCANGPCYQLRLMSGGSGRIQLHYGPGYEGHAGQFLTVLAQSRVPADYPLRVDGQHLTVADLVGTEQLRCRSGGELTFQLIGLAYYLENDARWRNELGEAWDLPRMIKLEIEQPIVGATCGGTHRLTALRYAVRNRERSGEPLTGQWGRADTYLQDYYEHTFKLQNADGSFSTAWFGRRGDQPDIHRKLNTTGHTLEWLVYSLPEDRLSDPRLVRATRFLNELLWQYRGQSWSVASWGHAIHALCLFDERVFGGAPGQRAAELEPFRGASAGLSAVTAAEGPAARTGQQPAPSGGVLRRRSRR